MHYEREDDADMTTIGPMVAATIEARSCCLLS
jgi:hypothetical protein